MGRWGRRVALVQWVRGVGEEGSDAARRRKGTPIAQPGCAWGEWSREND